MIGNLSEELLNAILEIIPIEFSVVDQNDKVVAWNKHESRIFKRPKGVIGKDVHNCHPKQSIDKVEQILSEMKAGKREKARFWIDLLIEGTPHKVVIEYYALRDEKGLYLGCLESSQNISDLQAIQGQKRLLD